MNDHTFRVLPARPSPGAFARAMASRIGALLATVALVAAGPAATAAEPAQKIASADGAAVAPAKARKSLFAVSPAALTFSATAGGTAPSPAKITVSSTNGAALGFTVTSNRAWLTATPVKGKTPASLAVNASIAGLAAGNYVGQLVIAPDPPGGGSAARVPVRLTVRPAAPGNYAISGTVSPPTLGAGSVLALSGAASRSATADASGNYRFTGLPNGSYSVVPSRAATAFTPTSRSVTVNGADVAGVNFTASSGGNVLFFDDFTGPALASDWTVIQRRGPPVQLENECNTADAVGVSGGLLTITTSATPATCGDAITQPTRLPYTSGDIQWTSLSFTYGTVEVRGKFPPQATGTWPAIWLLGSNCQASNLVNGSEDSEFQGCPAQGTRGYREIDVVECDKRGWCHVVVAQGTAGWSRMCEFQVDDDWHVFKLTWDKTATAIAVDGVPTGCSFPNTALNDPMFLIIQTQTTTADGVAGLPNNAKLPTQFLVDYVKVTQP